MSVSAVSMKRPPLSRAPLRLLGDDRLARLAAKGDQAAAAAIYERHHVALYRYVLTIVRHDEDAQDVLQTTMANALAALRRRPPDAPLRPWLFRIAHNEAISALRRRRPTAELDETATEAAAANSLERTVEDRRRLALLVSDLRDLPERQRGALVMRELSGLSHVEIASALEISPAKAKQAILEARLSLQEFEKGRAMDCAEVRELISAEDGRKLRGRNVRAHLRGCPDCRALRDSIRTRQADLAFLAPPLPAALSAGLLAQILGGGGGGGAVAVGKAAGGTVLAKALAGAAVVATVGAGVGASGVIGGNDGPDRAGKDRRAPAAERPAGNPKPPPVVAGGTGAASGAGAAGDETSEPKRRVRRARLRSQAETRRQSGQGRRAHGKADAGVGAGADSSPAATAPGQAKPKREKGVKNRGHAKKPKLHKPKPHKKPKKPRTPRPIKTPKPTPTPKPKPAPTPKRTPRPKPTRTPSPTASPAPQIEDDDEDDADRDKRPK